MANTGSISSTERIKQLNEIDQDVVKLIRSAGSALEALTTFNDGAGASVNIENQKEKFSAASAEYLKLLSSIDVRLRRQIIALQNAEIIPAEAVTRDLQGVQAVQSSPSAMGGPAALNKTAGVSRTAITGGGLGSLDVGWLNSRNDHNGRQMEASLWEEAQTFVQKLKKDQETASNTVDGGPIQEAQSNPEPQHESSQMDQS